MKLRLGVPLALAGVLAILPMASAQASDEPDGPTFQPDATTVTAGSYSQTVNIFANDNLAGKTIICSGQSPIGKPETLFFIQDPSTCDAHAYAYPDLTPDTYTFDEILWEPAPDHTILNLYLTPMTVTVLPSPADQMQVTAGRDAGTMRITNHNQQPVRFVWGSSRDHRRDGMVTVGGGDHVVVPVHRRSVLWYIRTRHDYGGGITRKLDVPTSHPAQPPGVRPGQAFATTKHPAWAQRLIGQA